MTSPAGTRFSPPSWGPVPWTPGRHTRTPEPPRHRARRAFDRTTRGATLAARRAAAAVTPDAVAGVVLLVGWVALWVLFLLGIVEPAAALRLVR